MMVQLLTFLFFISILFGSPSKCRASSAGEGDLRLEGIVYEEEKPGDSVAVIGDGFFKAGDHCGGYEIVKVEMTQVTVRDLKTGAEKILPIPDKSRVMKRASLAGERGGEQVPQESGEDLKSFLESSGGSWDSLINMAKEIQAISEMRSIVSRVKVYAKGLRPSQPLNMAKLVAGGILEGFAPDGTKGNYRYRLFAAQDGVDIYAEPVERGPAASYFFMDAKGQVFVEKGKRAGEYSKRYQSFLE